MRGGSHHPCPIASKCQMSLNPQHSPHMSLSSQHFLRRLGCIWLLAGGGAAAAAAIKTSQTESGPGLSFQPEKRFAENVQETIWPEDTAESTRLPQRQQSASVPMSRAHADTTSHRSPFLNPVLQESEALAAAFNFLMAYPYHT